MNRGFPASANAGLRASEGRDVVLLNGDTLVPPRWLERLREAAYSAREIGTVSPLSNEASILSYPDANGANPAPDLAGTARIARLAHKANAGILVDIPTSGRVLHVHPAGLPERRSGCCAKTCSRRAMARKTTSACARIISAGGTSQPPASSSRMRGPAPSAARGRI